MIFEIKKQKGRMHPRSWLKASTASVLTAFFLTACSDFFEPVDSTPAPTEYTYNYWLLQRTYLFEDELPLLDEQGDSVSELYNKLSDPFTRYVPPAKSEATKNQINTSIVPGDVGMEYSAFLQSEHPLVIYRVYTESPAGRAGIPRYGNILNVNGVEIVGERAKAIYDSVLTFNRNLAIKVAHQGDNIQHHERRCLRPHRFHRHLKRHRSHHHHIIQAQYRRQGKRHPRRADNLLKRHKKYNRPKAH